MFECSDSRGAPLRTGRRERVPSSGPSRSRRRGRTREPRCRCPVVRTHQGRMVVRAPLVEAEQDSSIRIQDLTKVVMARRRLGLAEERLVPFEAV
jgi:hypothetical protein